MTSKPKKVFITGVAGFIGSYVAHSLLDQGVEIIGVDNLNDYYLPRLKQMRLERLTARRGFAFHNMDIADHEALLGLEAAKGVEVIVHLAAQAGVRYSLENPFAYAASNLTGHLSILELVRHAPERPRLVYASSSSVYGANTKAPFSEKDPVTQPVSLYAATKRADELMSEAYARLYGVEQIGLRFFTVYGPWGRPDMAYWSFTENILSGKPIRVFNDGDNIIDISEIAHHIAVV
ncbi:MAG: NAD-dependent epimerase/dehydratase family protein, partial [Pseudomonadota bacterium]